MTGFQAGLEEGFFGKEGRIDRYMLQNMFF